jgi:hypothetical protein
MLEPENLGQQVTQVEMEFGNQLMEVQLGPKFLVEFLVLQFLRRPQI